MARAGEVVVILGHVGHDAEAVGDTHGDHVIGVQESRDPQLLLGHFKGLGWGQVPGEVGAEAATAGRGRGGRFSGSPVAEAQLLSGGWGDQGRGDYGLPSALAPHNNPEKGEAWCSGNK